MDFGRIIKRGRFLFLQSVLVYGLFIACFSLRMSRSTTHLLIPASPASIASEQIETWMGVFAAGDNSSRYLMSHADAVYVVHMVHTLDELKRPGLLGVVFDEKQNESQRDVLVNLIVNGFPVLVGPKAKSVAKLAWELKPGVDAAGGIFEIATSEVDFRFRLESLTRAALLRRHKVEVRLPAWPSIQEGYRVVKYDAQLERAFANNIEPSALTDIPGLKAATHDIRNSKSGRLDGELIRLSFGLKRTELATLLGVTPEALRQTPDSPKHQETFAHFERIAALRALLADSADFSKWLQSPNTELENLTPGELILEGRAPVVADLVQDILTNRGS